MDKECIKAQIALLERQMATLDGQRVAERIAARQQLDGAIECISTQSVMNIAGSLATIIRCNAMFADLTFEIAFLKGMLK